MADDSLTLGLGGEVSMVLFARAVQHFNGLIQALSKELLNKTTIDWVIEDLQPGSATMTVHGEPTENEDVDRIDRIVRAYAAVGRSLEHNERPGYSDRVIREAMGIVELLNERMTSVRFATADAEATIVSPSAAILPRTTYLGAYGAVEGRVQTVTSRRGLRFTLYDSLYDHAVSCYLGEKQEELMRGVWGRRAVVEGWISRDPISGRPVAIRRIFNVTVLPDVAPGSYEKARGALPYDPADVAPEERVRQVRDAW